MSRPSTSTLRLIAATLAIFAAMPMAGRAATFAVDPIAVTLPKGNSSASVAVTNQSTQPLRLQVSGFAWDQKPDGEMDLTATDALVFFPQLLTLAAGETKRVRIGVTTAQGPSEKAYRVFMEELPSLQSVVAPERASVTIRMKVGIPVFVSSGPTATVNGAIRNADARGGALSFDVLNTGNTHFTIQTVHVDGKNAAGASVLSQNVTGWYLLPGNTRHFSVPLPADRCSDLRTLAVKVQTNTVAFANTIADLTKQCDAGGAR
jgi:fimbrial chaperone protein